MKLKKPRKEEVRILIVDDETIVALDIKNTLEKYGYTVIGVAANAGEAINMAKTSRPNLILMDIMLKGSKDGIEVSSEINKFADIPIIFLTAYSDDHTLERAKKVEPYGYLIKPFDNRELFTTIEMSLYKHSMELSVRESEESLSITLNSIGDAVISTDENGLVVRMNPVAEKLTGWKFNEAKGKNLGEIFFLISASTREPMNNPVDKVIKSGEVIGLSNHTILIARDGTERNISDSAAPIRDQDGIIKGVVLVFSDVTETYKTREAINASEEKFRLLITRMHQGMAVHEAVYDKKGKFVDYRFIDVNASFESLTGLKRENILGKTVLEVMPGTESYWIEKYGYVVKTGNPISYENYSQELGRYYEVVAYRNRPNQFAVIITDITDRKIAEEELRVKDQAIASSINAIALANLEGNLTYVNNSFLKLWGYENIDEVLGRSVLEFWENKDGARIVAESVKEKGSYIGELKAKRKDGKLLELFLTSTLVYGTDEKPVQIMASFIDITERKIAEERIRLMADLLDLTPASVVVHDMQGNILYVNKKSLELHGYTEKQFLKLNLRDLDTPESAELIEQRIAEINRIGELTFEVSHRRKDGTSFPLQVHTKKTKWGGKEVLLSISNDITEQKKQEEILRLKTEELDNYFTSALDLFCIANKDGYFIKLNKQWENVLGYELSQLEGKRFIDFIHPDDMESTLNSIYKLSNQNEVIGFTNRYRAKDGSYKFIEWNSYPAGNRIYAAARDITERKKAEDAMRESEEMFRSYVESAPDAIMVVDEKGNYVLVNKAACEMTGYSKDQLLEMQIMDVTYKEDLSKGKAHFKKVVEQGEATDEVRFVTKNGEVRYWSVKAVKLSEDRFLGFQSDITERKLAEEALKESEERYKTFIESTDDMAFVKDESLRYIITNNVLANLFGKQPAEVVGKTDNDLMSPEGAANCMDSDLRAIHENRLIISEETVGDKIYETRKFPVHFKNGSVGVGGYIREITEKKLAEVALKNSEEKFRSLVSSLNDIVYTLDTEQRHTGVFGDWVEKSGLTEEFFLGKTAKEIFGQENSQVHEEANLRALNGENVVYEWSIESGSDVKYLQTSVSPLLNSSEQIIGIVGVARDITSLKTAEESIRISEEKFRNLFTTMPNGYYRSTPDGYFVDANPAFIKMLGYDNLEDLKKVYIPTDIFVQSSERENILTNNPDFISELETYRLKTKDGRIIWVEDNARYIKDRDGKVIFNEGICKDITDSKTAEDSLKESEEKFRNLFEKHSAVKILIDPITKKIIDANESAAKFYGWSVDELKRKKITDINTLPESKISSLMPVALSHKQDHFEFQHRLASGVIRDVEVFSSKITLNKSDCLHLIVHDITEKKKAEQALRESEQLFNTLAQVSPVGIFRTKPDGGTTYVNPTWTRLAGIAAEKAMGDGWLEAVHPDDREKLSTGWIDDSAKQDVSVAEYRFLRPDGNIVWVMGQAIPEFSPDNKIVGYVGTITDITERKFAEEALKESEEKFRSITEQTNSLISLTDNNGIITYASPASVSLFNCKPEEMIGCNFAEFLDQSSIPLAVEAFRKALSNQQDTKNLELKMKRSDGTFFFGELNGSRFEWGEQWGTLVVINDISERKESEIALLESEERLRILAEKTGTIVYDRDLKTNIVHRTGAIEEVLGYSKEEYNKLTVDQFNELLHEEDRTNIVIEENRVIKTGGNLTQFYRMRHKNGNYIQIEDNCIVLTDENGIGIRMLGSMKDITERKKDEENLRKLSHAVEQSQVSIVITNKNGAIEYVNPKFCQITGYTYEEAIGQNPRILKSGDWKSEAYAGMWKDLSSGRNWTGIFHNKKKNGEFFWESAHISPIKNSDGEITHYIAVKEDISEKVKAEEELIRYREHLEEMVEERTAQVNSQNVFLRTLIDTIPNPLFVKDSNGYYTDVNPAFEKFFNKKREVLIGKNLEFILTDEAKKIAAETDERLKQGQGIVSYELMVEKGDGNKVPILVYKSSFGISSNEPEGIMGMFIDISERKEMEEKTILALNKERELNEMKTNFISMASHEFRTPLTTILASADLVEMYYSKWTEEKVINHIKKIQDSVNYMTTLLDDVLTLSRADRGKLKFTPAKANVREICKQIMDEINYQALPGHNLIFNYNLKTEFANIDKKLLHQILNNLLSNAVKFSPEGGNILLEVSDSGNKIQFTVKDEGLGIDGNDIKNIFEPFFRGKNVTEIHGSGLGLNIVKNAVELHGGEISMESELNKGTKFTFTIKPKNK